MLLPKFDYIRPESLQEASRLLADKGGAARLMAGGTDLLPRMKYDLLSCDSLVSLGGISVQEPELGPDGGLRVHAMMRLADLAANPLVVQHAPCLAEAALEVASNQVRQMATLGGNLCQDARCLFYNQAHTYQFMEPCFKRGGDLCYFMPKGKKCWAVFMSDTATALIALGAEVELINKAVIRKLPLLELYSGDSSAPLTLLPGEILQSVIVPPISGFPGRARGSAFIKFAMRGGVEFAGLNVAASLSLKDNGGACGEAIVAVGAVGSAPLLAKKAGQSLSGRTVNDESLDAVAAKAAEEIRPFPHHGYQASYLRTILQIKVKESLSLAWQRAVRLQSLRGETQ